MHGTMRRQKDEFDCIQLIPQRFQSMFGVGLVSLIVGRQGSKEGCWSRMKGCQRVDSERGE